MKSSKSGKVCNVCGDKAQAKNFCAISCESCKAFFRRNASHLEELTCTFGDNCYIDIDTRKRCRKCRLRKCFEIGMRKEWILNENEKRERNQKREENRKRRLQNMTDKECSMSQSSSSSGDNSEDKGSDSISFDNNTTEESLSSDVSQSCVQYFTELVPISRPITDYTNNLNEMESNRLTELIEATKFLTIPSLNIKSEITSLWDVLKATSIIWDQEIRKIIKTAKTLSKFKEMCEEDKISLLKHSSVEIAFLRSIICYESHNEYYSITMNENDSALVSLAVFKQRSLENYECVKLYLDKLSLQWDMDYLILHLLMTILLFNPNRPGLVHRQLVRLQQQVYMHLLKRYLQLRYRSESEAKERFNRFIEILDDLHNIHETHIRGYLAEHTAETPPFLAYSPILKEIYDK